MAIIAQLRAAGCAQDHAPTMTEAQRIGQLAMWMRSFDRYGGKIPPADWRTRIEPRR